MDNLERHTTGRPTKFTAEVRARLLEAIAEGATYKLACKYANVGYSTFADWMQRGAAGEAPYVEFSEQVTHVEAEAGMIALAAWRGHFETDFRAPRDFMATRFRDDGYGKQETHILRDERPQQATLPQVQIIITSQYLRQVADLIEQPALPDPDVIDVAPRG